MMAYDTVPQPREAAVMVAHDARAIYDTASLRLEQFMSEGELIWVVAIVTRGPTSGSATIPGAYINTATGEFVKPPNAQTVLVKDGKWRALATSKQAAEYGEKTYSWTEPLNVEKRQLLPEDYYSPFANGGTIVFRPVSGAVGIEQFGTVRLIFPDWAKYVTATFDFISSQPVFLRNRPVTPSELSQLTNLLSQENKLLAALAFRELVTSGQMATKPTANLLIQAEANLGAIYTYIVLTSPEAGRQQLVQKISSIAKTAHDPTKLRSIALGAFAAGLFRVDDSGALSSSKFVLGVVRQRFRQLQIPLEKDPYLVSIFEKMGV